MSALNPKDAPDEESNGEPDPGQGGGHSRWRGHSRWMMIACCVPMLVIAAIVAFSGAGFGFFVVAVMCTAMMAMMMGAMTGGR